MPLFNKRRQALLDKGKLITQPNSTRYCAFKILPASVERAIFATKLLL